VRWQEIALRLTLIVALFVAILDHASVWFAAPLGLLAVAATAELATRTYAANAPDRLLLSCGAVVVTLILAGLVLNLMPWGLTQTTWAITWTILSIAVLIWRRNLATRMRIPISTIRPFGPWILAASLIIIFAVMLALAGVRQWNQKPVVAFALVSASPNSLIVEIDSKSTNAMYRIVATSRMSGARPYSSAPVTVRSGGNGTRVLRRVPINTKGVWMISLEPANTRAPARWLRVTVP